MKSLLLCVSIALVFGSCTTAYKSGQTPDDVYFSPERPRPTDEYVKVDEDKSPKYRYQEEEYYEDRDIRMKVRNRRAWSNLDYYYSDPYAYNYYRNYYYNNYYNNYWTPYTSWNYYYNPYYSPYYSKVIVVNPKSPAYNQPRTYNLHVFDGTNSNNPRAPKRSRVFDNSGDRNYNAPRRDAGRDLRNILGSSNNNSNSSSTQNNAPARTQSSGNSNNNSSSSESKSGSNAPVRKF